MTKEIKQDLEELREAYFELSEKVDKIVDAQNSLVIEIRMLEVEVKANDSRFASSLTNIDDLSRRFAEHINPDYILPRFKDEILKALDDDEFRKKFYKLSTRQSPWAGNEGVLPASGSPLSADEQQSEISKDIPWSRPRGGITDDQRPHLSDQVPDTRKMVAEKELCAYIEDIHTYVLNNQTDARYMKMPADLWFNLRDSYKKWKELL